MNPFIVYRAGYKYQLAADYSVKLANVRPIEPVNHEYFTLTLDGWLTVKEGYAWDGASGPTHDSKSSMRPSLVHDVLWQMLRVGLLDEAQRHETNLEFHRLCIEDGMWPWRADVWLWAIEKFGKFYTGSGEEPTLTAP